ncbi:hypothetical protein BT96DRAFT_1023832 [Gymnopus androsaceus JB14]|uniref:Uncharacterized protein n=1 Tax=Gymnopus androsaceus JB14 TaxID=1447944 RepID=A0A6A4H435_9AGAR|nr:hypothetical protein BT96DRAFT_1023832 [Gymnopus androsaceus JB14]
MVLLSVKALGIITVCETRRSWQYQLTSKFNNEPSFTNSTKSPAPESDSQSVFDLPFDTYMAQASNIQCSPGSPSISDRILESLFSTPQCPPREPTPHLTPHQCRLSAGSQQVELADCELGESLVAQYMEQVMREMPEIQMIGDSDDEDDEEEKIVDLPIPPPALPSAQVSPSVTPCTASIHPTTAKILAEDPFYVPSKASNSAAEFFMENMHTALQHLYIVVA